jgi:glycosyltransferase involved in cell wall biosynthesis/GT2 family glycosyltransferase
VPSGGPTLFVTHSGQSGGAGHILADVVASLPGGAVVACPPGPVADACRARGATVLALRRRPLGLRGGAREAAGAAAALAGHAREVRGLVRELDPAVLVTWGMRTTLAAALVPRRAHPRWVAAHHDFLPRGAPGRAVRAALGRADAVAAISRAVADELALRGPVEVILPGVDLERFHPPDARDAAAAPTVLWLGAIVPWKRPGLALDVARRLPGIRLRLAGAPIDAEGERLLGELRLRIERDGLGERVEIAGAVDAPEAHRASDALLHTADREPFGMAIVEALASGVPAAAPRSGGPAEIVDEGCGRLFEPDDAGSAARALDEVLADRARLAAGARRRAETAFDLRRAHRQWADVLAAPTASDRASGADVALVTVSHDSSAELDALLRSVRRHLPGAEVVVADSGSSDDSAAVARRHGATVVELDNVGYGAAANAGLERVGRAFTVVLNPDVELVDASLAELAREAPAGRLFVPAVLRPDGSRQDVAHHEPATARLAAFSLVPPALLPPRLRTPLEPWRARRPRRVAWGVGACIAGRTETLRALGPFDPAIFLYGEDLDLGLRAGDAGVETWFWPGVRVVHRQGHSTERAFGGEPFELLARRRRDVIAARRGQGRARLDDLLQALTFANRIALKALVRRDTTRERRLLAALRAARRAP